MIKYITGDAKKWQKISFSWLLRLDLKLSKDWSLRDIVTLDDNYLTDHSLCHTFTFIWDDHFLLRLKKYLMVLPDLPFFIFPCVSASKLQFHWFIINLLFQSVFRPSFSGAFLGQWSRRLYIRQIIITLATVAKYISSDHNQKITFSKLFIILQGYKLNTIWTSKVYFLRL